MAVSSVLQLLGEQEPEILQARFTNYVMDPSKEDETENRIRSAERILGDSAFKKSLRGSGSTRLGHVAETATVDPMTQAIDIEGAPV